MWDIVRLHRSGGCKDGRDWQVTVWNFGMAMHLPLRMVKRPKMMITSHSHIAAIVVYLSSGDVQKIKAAAFTITDGMA